MVSVRIWLVLAGVRVRQGLWLTRVLVKYTLRVR